MVRAGGEVMDADGLRGVVERAEADGAAGLVLLRFAGGQLVSVPAHMLQPQADGSYRLGFGFASLAGGPGRPGAGAEWVVPVVAEELSVDRRVVEKGRVRVTKTVRERQEVVDEPLWREEIDVERVPVGRVVEGPVGLRQEGDTLIVPLLEEVLVVERRLLLREELHLRRRRVPERAPQTVTLRREEAQVEHLGPADEAPGAGSGEESKSES